MMIFATAAARVTRSRSCVRSVAGDRRKIFGPRVTKRPTGPKTKKDECHLRGDAEWADLMRAAKAGNGAAYDRCLREIAQALRPLVRRGMYRAGANPAETEDVVQDILIAVHLKRHTWDDTRPIGPWIAGIARYKIIDSMRRRGSRIELPIEDFAEIIPAETETEIASERDVARSLEALPEGQRNVVRSIAIDGTSIADTAQKLNMSEGAVRVALHRGLGALAKRHSQDT
jgi:RNA polymerase sigma-70 factor (ECF subfamily)